MANLPDSSRTGPFPTGAASNVAAIDRSGFLSFVVGLALFTTSPPFTAIASYLQVPFVGSYLISYFDLAVAFGCLTLAWNGRFRFDEPEKPIYWALALVMLTRVLSLIAASNMAMEQAISILRYVETFAIVIMLANLLSLRQNRRLFLRGIIVGVLIETTGDLLTFFWSGGEERGVWLGVDNYKLQVFLLFACFLSFSQKKGRSMKIVAGLCLLLGILATETRSAVFLFLVSLVPLLLTRHKAMLKPALALLVLAAVAVVPVIRLLPEAAQNATERLDELWTGGGTVGLRLILWEMALAAYVSHPITGIGSGGFARQQNTLYLQINDAYAPGYETKYDQISAQNTVLGVAAETGTLGLIAYFIWMAAVIRICLRGIRLEGFYRDPYALAAGICLLAMMAGDWWGQYSFMPPSTCLLGFVMGWCRAHREPERPALLAPSVEHIQSGSPIGSSAMSTYKISVGRVRP
jgi:O-antigen ligase